MLSELHDLALGPVSPTVAVIFAAFGGLLGVILAARARRCTGGRRARLVAYATASVAGPGIWLPGLVGVLGLRVDSSVVRADPKVLAMGLGVAAIAAALALLLLCYGRQGPDRLIGATILLAGAVAGSAYLTLRSLATGGRFVIDQNIAAVALITAIIAGAVLALQLGVVRSLRWAVAVALPLGLVVTSVHVIATAALSVRPGPQGTTPAYDVPGLSPMEIGLPAIVLGGALTAMMWYFSVGTATRRDLNLIFGSETDGEIEPWMIDQVRSRVAVSSTALAPGPGWFGDVWAETTVAVRSIPLIGGAVASAFARGARQFRTGEAPPAYTEPPTVEQPTIDHQILEPAPVWRPVPGWGGASMRSGTSWDERDRDRPGPAVRHEPRTVTNSRSRLNEWPSTARATNRRHGQFGEPAETLVRWAGNDNGAGPLPRRNARS
jgi:NO-binding membrane sensor protein with MHYT domain